MTDRQVSLNAVIAVINSVAIDHKNCPRDIALNDAIAAVTALPGVSAGANDELIARLLDFVDCGCCEGLTTATNEAAQALAADDARIAEQDLLLQQAMNDLNACKDALAQVE